MVFTYSDGLTHSLFLPWSGRSGLDVDGQDGPDGEMARFDGGDGLDRGHLDSTTRVRIELVG